DNIRIAAPCSADWAKMSGDDRARFCGDCKLNVYNLSDMTRDEAEALIREREGRLCVRYYQRADGTILLKDCTVGVHRRRRRRIAAAGVAAAPAGFGGGAATEAGGRAEGEMIVGRIPIERQPSAELAVDPPITVHQGPPAVPQPDPQRKIIEMKGQLVDLPPVTPVRKRAASKARH